jgi:hypothetical protein
VIFVISRPSHQPRHVCTIDETDSAVVLQEKVVRNLANGWPLGILVTPYSEKKLVLSGRQASSVCLLLTPAFETAQTRSQR